MRAQGEHIIVGSDGAAFATARAAQERGYNATVLVPRGAPSVRTLPNDIKARDLDPREKNVFVRAFKDASFVYYCCGTATLPIDEDEPERLSRIIEGVRQARAKFIYCDAPYAYGLTTRVMTEEMPPRARDPFGSFLAALAQFVLHSHRMGEVEAVLARHADLFGPQVARSHFGEPFVLSVMHRRPLSVLGRVNAPRTLTYTPDLGRALVLLAEQEDTWGQLWHLPSLPPVTPERLINAMRASEGFAPIAHNGIHEIRSQRPLFGLGGSRHTAQRALARFYEAPFTLSSAKFERAFGMHATPFKDMVEETVQSLKRV
jgi:nucleoside-diphosphate-sugar epimerase